MNARPLSHAVWFGREAKRCIGRGSPAEAAAFARSAARYAKKHLRARAISETALLRNLDKRFSCSLESTSRRKGRP